MTYGKILEIEDYLELDCRLFVNGISGKPAHSDSYMTVLEYSRLGEVDKSRFSQQEWLEACEHWLSNVNCGPALKLFAKWFKRK